MPSPTRRALLRKSAAVLPVATLGSLAGCSAITGSDPGERTTFGVPGAESPGTTRDFGAALPLGSVSPPDPGPPTYRRWLPAPSKVGPETGGDSLGYPTYDLQVVDVERIRERGEAVPPELSIHRRFATLGLDEFGVGFDRYSRVVRLVGSLTRAAVVEAPLDPEAVAGTLRETGYRRAGEYRGDRLFVRDDGPRAVAVRDGALVFSSADAGAGEDGHAPTRAVRTVLDARAGRVPRFHETDPAFERLTRAAGGPPLAWVLTGPFSPGTTADDDRLEGLAGTAVTWAFDADSTYLQRIYAFDAPTDREAVERTIKSRLADRESARSADAVAVDVGRRTATTTARVADDRYAEVFEADADTTYPQVTWGFESEKREGEDGQRRAVTVTHEAGTRVPTETLTLRSGGEILGAFAGVGETVGPGDAVTATVPATPDPDPFRIVWESPGDRVVWVLERYQPG